MHIYALLFCWLMSCLRKWTLQYIMMSGTDYHQLPLSLPFHATVLYPMLNTLHLLTTQSPNQMYIAVRLFVTKLEHKHCLQKAFITLQVNFYIIFYEAHFMICTPIRVTYIQYSRKICRELYLAIWPPTAEIKYWRNWNLAICDCKAKFHYVILACGYGGS